MYYGTEHSWGQEIFHFPTLVNFGPPYYKVVIGFEDIFLKQRQNKSKYIQAEQGAIQPQNLQTLSKYIKVPTNNSFIASENEATQTHFSTRI